MKEGALMGGVGAEQQILPKLKDPQKYGLGVRPNTPSVKALLNGGENSKAKTGEESKEPFLI